eukprot:CAMPEP_0202895694 /NCGR_PEP_ID=MMETSP1392-20130828/4846_1 /ASSEMBLY_ACC=CAM_ASM_000868 /TAXON_ID=225041 /ORGANISM="Chlamydomonas chlamydogama, Strain SAG 11-48b" /LENGTH=1234 /DNA_ID=CAMNT_0049580803 /DNA_START=259 /DNA_END=3963 /DNA_ORIENTATION=-
MLAAPGTKVFPSESAREDACSEPKDEHTGTFMSRLKDMYASAKSRGKALLSLVRSNPHTAAVPFVVLLVCVALGVFAVLYSANEAREKSIFDAHLLATAKAKDIETVFRGAFFPTRALAGHVMRSPQFSDLKPLFDGIAAQLIGDSQIMNLQLAPNGIISVIYPLAGNTAVLNRNLFNATNDYIQAIETVKANTLVLSGPRMLAQGFMGAPVRYPIFLEGYGPNETFGMPPVPTNCQGYCYTVNTTTLPNGTQVTTTRRFWGFASALFRWETLLEQMHFDVMVRAGYDYRLVRPVIAGVDSSNITEFVLASGTNGSWTNPLADGVTVNISAPHYTWNLTVVSVTGWDPSWKWPLVATTVVVSLLVAALLFSLLVSRLEHRLLLEATLPQAAIKKLRDEMYTVDAKCPKTWQIYSTGTLAEHMTGMLGALLEGMMPEVRDVVTIRNAIRDGGQLYEPINLGEQMIATNLDSDVQAALLTELGRRPKRNLSTSHGKQSDDTLMTEGDDYDEDDDILESGLTGGNGLGPLDIDASVDDHMVCYPATNHTMHRLMLTLMQPAPQQMLGGWSTSGAGSAGGSPGGIRPHLSGGSDGTTDGAMPTGSVTSARMVNMKGLAGIIEASALTNGSFSGAPPLSSSVTSQRLQPARLSNSSDTPRRRISNSSTSGANPSGRAGSLSGVSPARTSLHLQQPPQPRVPYEMVIDEAERVLATADSFEFDAFKLAEVTSGHALSVLGYYLVQRAGLFREFRINPVVMARFVREVERGYLDNPYHNSMHAADVLQSMHVLLHRGGLVPGYARPVEVFACYLAAMVHDYGHIGVTNDFIINAGLELAERYNDRSPQENHHVAATFALLRKPGNNVLEHMNKSEYQKLRKLMIELVLATDMKQHFAIVGQFSTIHRLADTKALSFATTELSRNNSARGAPMPVPGGWGSPTGGGSQNAPPRVGSQTAAVPGGASGGNGAKKLSGGTTSGDLESGATTGGGGSVGKAVPELAAEPSIVTASAASVIRVPLDENERILTLQMALKCADIGHISSPLHVHIRWVGCLEEEFFLQGDREKAASMPISPLFDRAKQGVTKSQVGFFDFVVLPLMYNFTRVHKAAEPIFSMARKNYQYWVEQHAKEQAHELQALEQAQRQQQQQGQAQGQSQQSQPGQGQGQGAGVQSAQRTVVFAPKEGNAAAKVHVGESAVPPVGEAAAKDVGGAGRTSTNGGRLSISGRPGSAQSGQEPVNKN